MRDQTFERLTSRQLVGIDRFSPGVLLPVAFLCGALAQWLFYGVPLGVNLALAVIGMLILCWILRPAGARVDALDRWVVPVAVIFAFLPTLRSDLMLLLFDVPAMLVLVGMAAVCFAGVPVTRRALDLLVVLVGLQIAYLFGGLDTLNATGLTYSEYARRGFFELIAAGLVVGGLIFGVELVVARRSRPYVLAALTLVLATLVVVGSAAYRMHLYQLAYGWTEQRFYALAGIAWLGAGGAVAIACIARDATRWLVHAGGALGLGVAVAINVLGPTGFVARQTLARVAAGGALLAV